MQGVWFAGALSALALMSGSTLASARTPVPRAMRAAVPRSCSESGPPRASLHLLAFANRTSTSPWQGRGAHQHPSTFPRSSPSAAISSSFSSSQRS
jgi:hypothetical protein